MLLWDLSILCPTLEAMETLSLQCSAPGVPWCVLTWCLTLKPPTQIPDMHLLFHAPSLYRAPVSGGWWATLLQQRESPAS